MAVTSIPDPWSTATAYPSSPLYSTAATPAALSPDAGESFQNRVLNKARALKDRIGAGTGKLNERVGNRPVGRYATLGAAGLGAATTAAGGDVLGAVGELGGGLAGGAIASTMFRGAMAAPGALGLAARVGIPLAGTLLGGGVGKAVVGGAAGAIGAKAEEPGANPMYIPGTNIPLNQAAQLENLRDRDLAYQLKASKSQSEQDLQINRQYMADARNDEILRAKAMMPLQEQINRSNLVNAQAMLASQTAAYQQLGRTAGMFKLAQGAQAETGATLRTAISNNPYLGATLSAPNISFG